MNWWKFWTWYRRDDAHGSAKTHRDLRGTDSGPHETEDILGSISGLIGDQQEDRSIDLIPFATANTRTAEAIRKIVASDKIERTETSEVSGKTEQEEVRPAPAPVEAVLQIPPTEPVTPPVASPERIVVKVDPPKPQPQKPTREPSPLSRDIARRDPRKTLVAEDGQWPSLKGLSDSFKDLDDADDSDDGPSPFQTMVPNDD